MEKAEQGTFQAKLFGLSRNPGEGMNLTQRRKENNEPGETAGEIKEEAKAL